MNHVASPAFWDLYGRLPPSIRRLADKNFDLIKENPNHPSLRFRQVGRYWSARVGIDFRAVAVRRGDDCVWFWIGPHDEYDKLLK